ncbi:hypothetical protein RMSM_00986 [Rhodopirellula maiorica SM1]|uniref:Uncharacterized protein n=1 Tax=Rhodopirellula maiorica SM1 TaxID=1265738 RepID=M5S375_9BACT|nr:hypothetical protein [Rhodopirellula maiorica]EMI22087.1 hypothetical protein RMSM_00986 [Rhodopirellula maiorica SM1]
MIKRFNSLGRKRVPRECVTIEVEDGDPRRFSAHIDFGSHNWDSNGTVVLEATCAGSSLVQRFDCGTVGQLKQPAGLPLSDLHGQNVFFSLKIIDTSQRIGRLLGVADNIRPIATGKQTVSGRKGILPVEHALLGQELWKLEFREHDVFLLVNQDVPSLSESIRSDPVFFSLIYPQVMRQVLHRAIMDGRNLTSTTTVGRFCGCPLAENFTLITKNRRHRLMAMNSSMNGWKWSSRNSASCTS